MPKLPADPGNSKKEPGDPGDITPMMQDPETAKPLKRSKSRHPEATSAGHPWYGGES